MVLNQDFSPFGAIILILIYAQIPIVGSPNVMQNAIKSKLDAYLTENLIGLVNVRYNVVIIPCFFNKMNWWLDHE